MRLFAFLTFFLSLSTLAESGLRVIPSDAVEYPRLLEIYKVSRSYFESVIGALESETVVEISPRRCLRTGYNRRTQSVVFCPNSSVRNSGLESIDVIHHEFFHSFICQKFADLCEDDQRIDLHEAMADVFAYRLNPDEYFGENFYKELKFIRPYKTNWRVGLVRTPHERGLALASVLIQQGMSFQEMLRLFTEPSEDSVKIVVSGTETSSLNRYRLSPGQEIEVDFLFAPEEGSLSVAWTGVEGMLFQRMSQTKYKVKNLNLNSSEKIRVSFIDSNGKVVGGQNFYFGPEISN